MLLTNPHLQQIRIQDFNMLIALLGPMHVGKTTLARSLLATPPPTTTGQPQLLPLALPVKEAVGLMRLPQTRQTYQAVGSQLRVVLGDDVWLRYWEAHLPPGYAEIDGPLVVVDDVRYQNELDAMIDAFIICLTVDRATQWKRYLTSEKFSASIARSEWDSFHNHATEQLYLTTAGAEGILTLDTTHMTAEEVEADVRKYIHASI